MDWNQMIESLYCGTELSIGFAEGMKWFSGATVSDEEQLRSMLEHRIPSLRTTRIAAGGTLALYLPDGPSRVHSDCIENPALRNSQFESDRPYFEALLHSERHDVALTPMDGADAAKCHCNARRWAQKHAGYRVVAGWLLEGNSRQNFICHSVVERLGEPLIDITPFEESSVRFRELMKFVRHSGTPAAFRRLRDRYNQFSLDRASDFP